MNDFFGSTWEVAVETVTNKTITVARLVIPMFLLWYCFVAARKLMFGGEGVIEAWTKVLQVFILFTLLTAYIPIMTQIDNLIDAIADYIRPQGSMNEIIGETIEKSINHGQENAGWLEAMKGIFSFKYLISGFVADGLSLLVRGIIYVLSAVSTSFLTVVGPLAIMFDCMPYFGEGTLKHWFNSFLSIKCWLITVSCIDSLLLEALKIQTINGIIVPHYDAPILMVLVFVVLYLMTPVITKFYVQGSGGSLAGAVIGAAATGAAVATAVATKGASLGAKK